MNISIARAFQSLNLLGQGAIIIADFTPESGFEKENLTMNLGVRTKRVALSPVINASGTRDSTIQSC